MPGPARPVFRLSDAVESTMRNPCRAAAIALSLLCAVTSLAHAAQAGLPIDHVDDVVLEKDTRGKALQVRVTWPQPEGQYPVIVFSHGAWSSKDEYQPIVQHWAAQGYVILQPNHADSVSLGERPRSMESFKGWPERARDIHLLLDRLDEIARKVPEVASRMDRERIGMSGHSYGGQTTQLIAGYRVGNESYRDERVQAAILLAPPGGVPSDTPQSWADIEIPLLTITGDVDTSKRTGRDYTWRTDAYEHASSKDDYLIVVAGADHLLGGISQSRQSGRQAVPEVPEQLALVRDATTKFWDAYLKDDPDARADVEAGGAVARSATAATFESRAGATRSAGGGAARAASTAAASRPAAAAAPVRDAGPALPYDTELVDWLDESRDRTIGAKIFAPDPEAASGKRPTIVFSHGYGESRESFNWLGEYWAQHGYVAIFLTHPGSDRKALQERGAPRGEIEINFDPRPADIRFVLDLLESGGHDSKLLRDRVDLDRLAMAGQCMGSSTALFMVGLEIRREDGTTYSDPDPRFKVVVALSPQMPRSRMLEGTRAGAAAFALGEGAQRELYDGSWAKIDVPALIVTGTRDYELFPAVRRNPELIRMAYDGLPPGDRYLVEIVGAEHSAFTESEPWYRSGPRDPRHHGWMAEATTAFFDAYLEGDEEAREWLAGGGLNRATNGEVQQENKLPGATIANVPPPADAEKPTAPPPQPGRGGRRGDPGALVERFDTDGDGEVSRAEAPARLSDEAFDHLDRDRSDTLSARELEALSSRMQGAARQRTSRASTPERGGRTARATLPTASGPVVDAPKGEYALASKDLALEDDARNATVNVRVVYPLQTEGALPLIVFSPHQTGSKDEYVELLEYWASHGYVVVGMDHADSPGSGREPLPGHTDRPRDVTFVIDELPRIEGELAGFAGTIDRDRIGVAGHYLGAYTAYLLAGAVRHSPNGKAETFTDERVRAALLISPEGTGQGMTEDSWEKVDLPMMTITGEGDVSARTGKDAGWRKEPYALSAPGDKYLVDISGYVSTRRAPGRADAQTYSEVIGEASASYVYDASVTFWEAYLKDDSAALARLRSGALQQASEGAVTLSSR
jgi:predicted dienelactone hydrolase